MWKQHKLRFRIIFHLCLLFGAALVAQGYFTSVYLYDTSLAQIKQEQIERIDAYGALVEQKFEVAHKALIAVAQQLPVASLNHASWLQRWLDDRRGIASIYDNELFVFAADGTLIVESPYREKRRGQDFSFRNYYKQTLQTRKPFISDLYLSTQNHHHPVVMMTAPVFDSTGNIVAILGGSLDLLGDNFLGDLPKQKLGSGGYFYMVNVGGTVIVHPQQDKIGQQLGAAQLVAYAGANALGCVETVDDQGQAVLSAFRHLKVKNWVLISNYQMSEIQAPLLRYRLYFWISAVATFALLLLFTLLILRQVFAPLLRFTQHLSTLVDKQGEERIFDYAGHEEIGLLVSSFNEVLSEIDKAHEALDYAQQMAHLGSWHWNMVENELVWSDEVFRIFGDQPNSYVPDYALFLSRVHPDDRDKVAKVVADAIRNKTHYELEHRLVRQDGTTIYVREQGEAKYAANGRPVAMVGTVLDINNLIVLQNRLQELATIDELTGAVNRREFYHVADKMVKLMHRSQAELSLLFVDFDHFKRVNDEYGHLVGDEVLQQGVALLKSVLRSTDTLARYGGEEFCILLPDCHEQGAQIMAERCRVALAQQQLQVAGDRSLYITVSIGVATLRQDESLSSLVDRADQAVYQAKERGRNCIVAAD
ncbi:MAG: diguanylate cyclase [Desulfuromonas sp.]|nr:diguanylate cyclase [Desulfuromonas sp.]